MIVVIPVALMERLSIPELFVFFLFPLFPFQTERASLTVAIMAAEALIKVINMEILKNLIAWSSVLIAASLAILPASYTKLPIFVGGKVYICSVNLTIAITKLND